MARTIMNFVATLHEAGEKDADGCVVQKINDQNLTAWRQGGSQDWLREQERLDLMRAKREFAFEVARQNEGSRVAEATIAMGAAQIFELLDEADLRGVKELMVDRPENYAKIVNAAAKLAKPMLDWDKWKNKVAENLLNAATLRQAEKIAASGMSNAEKIAAMRKAAFADVDALQASGEIKLPKA